MKLEVSKTEVVLLACMRFRRVSLSKFLTTRLFLPGRPLSRIETGPRLLVKVVEMLFLRSFGVLMFLLLASSGEAHWLIGLELQACKGAFVDEAAARDIRGPTAAERIATALTRASQNENQGSFLELMKVLVVIQPEVDSLAANLTDVEQFEILLIVHRLMLVAHEKLRKVIFPLQAAMNYNSASGRQAQQPLNPTMFRFDDPSYDFALLDYLVPGSAQAPSSWQAVSKAIAADRVNSIRKTLRSSRYLRFVGAPVPSLEGEVHFTMPPEGSMTLAFPMAKQAAQAGMQPR